MLHYIYSRSFINVITFMVLALAAWGAMPAFVGARRWRCGNLALMLLMTVLSWVNSATASISSFSFSGSTLAVSSSRMMMGASFMMARAMDMVKDSVLNGIWLNVAEPVLTEQQRFALRFQRQQDLFSLLRGGEVEICRWLVKEKNICAHGPCRENGDALSLAAGQRINAAVLQPFQVAIRNGRMDRPSQLFGFIARYRITAASRRW